MGVLDYRVEDGKRVFIAEDERRVEVSVEDLEFIFKGFRPREMAYEDYKNVRRILKEETKRYLKGSLFHLSKVNDEVWAQYTKGTNKYKQKGQTYVKKKQDTSGSTDDQSQVI